MEVEAHSTLGKADLLELGKVGSYGVRGALVGILPLGDRFELVGRLHAGNERSSGAKAASSRTGLRRTRSTSGWVWARVTGSTMPWHCAWIWITWAPVTTEPDRARAS